MTQVLITGANRGIGLGLTRFFLGKGYKVLATSRNPEQSEELMALLNSSGTQLEVECLDVASDVSVLALAAKWDDRPLDILINNAGVLVNETATGVDNIDLAAIQASMQVNAYGAIRMCKAFLPVLSKAQSPRIINMTSKMGSIGDNTGGGFYAYRMSKTALNMFNKSLSVDAPQVTSVVLHPGWVQTDMGGSSALVTIEESTAGLGELIINFKKDQSGHFFDFTGEQIPW